MSEVDRLARDLAAGGEVVRKGLRPILSKGALNIKNATRKRWAGLSHAPALGRAVTYDVEMTATGGSAEIGPDVEKRQGYLGNVIEYGTVNNAPTPGLAPSLAEEDPRFVKNLGDLGVKAMPQ